MEEITLSSFSSEAPLKGGSDFIGLFLLTQFRAQALQSEEQSLRGGGALRKGEKKHMGLPCMSQRSHCQKQVGR